MTGGLSGYVCDAHTGQPIEGVAVEYDTYITWTNVDGWYEMGGIPEGIFYFFYSKEGYETTYWSIQISSEVWNHSSTLFSVHGPASLMPFTTGMST